MKTYNESFFLYPEVSEWVKFRPYLQCELSLFSFSNRCVNPYQYTIGSGVLNIFVLAYDKCKQVGGHYGSPLEVNYLSFPIFVFLLWIHILSSEEGEWNRSKGREGRALLFMVSYPEKFFLYFQKTFALPQGKITTMLTILERTTRSEGATIVTSNVAFKAGSSQQGKALRASVAWKRKWDRLHHHQKSST